jgi:Holliday junction resolvase RusA-like endonuclease
VKIILPWPDAKLNPNQSKGRHWGSTTAQRKKARNDAFWITRGALLEVLGGIQTISSGEVLALSITFVQPDKRARDRDNLLAALKPSLDGVADALDVNDSQFNPITIRREYGAKPGSVVVEIA